MVWKAADHYRLWDTQSLQAARWLPSKRGLSAPLLLVIYSASVEHINMLLIEFLQFLHRWRLLFALFAPTWCRRGVVQWHIRMRSFVACYHLRKLKCHENWKRGKILRECQIIEREKQALRSTQRNGFWYLERRSRAYSFWQDLEVFRNWRTGLVNASCRFHPRPSLCRTASTLGTP